MSSKTIIQLADLWSAYNVSTIPRKTSEVERLMMKKAFYAGAGSTVSNIIRACDVSTEFGTQVIDGFLDECVEFLRDLSEKATARQRQSTSS